MNDGLKDRIVTLYNNPDPFTNYATKEKNPSGSPLIVTLSDTANNYEELEITYGVITTNSSGSKWSPVTNTIIYTDCKTKNLYARSTASVNQGTGIAIQINVNRTAKTLEVVVFSNNDNYIVGFFISTVKGIRF